jgi:protein-disulfide isomerase
MKNASWMIALLVGVVAGVAIDRTIGGSGASRPQPSRPAPTAPAAARPAAPGGAAPTPSTTVAKVSIRDDDPARGPAGAPITIALFSDFQCPFCARVEPTLKQVEQAFPGSVRVVWKHQPLPATMHPQARPAAEAAEAAREQGKFWEMHDRLFESQRSLSPELYESTARALGLDVERFKRSLAAHAGGPRIDEDQRLAASVGATATPTLYVNCRRIEGAYPFDSIKPILDEEIRTAGALAKAGKSGPELYAAACEENLKKFPPTPVAGAPSLVPGGKAAVTVRADDPVKGKATASVTVVEFSDFQCPYCARATPTVNEMEAAFPQDVRVVWKHFPLSFHANAMPAALAAEAAREQGGSAKFWAMHDKLFANQAALSEAAYTQYARELGLDLARFRRDMESPKLKARVQEDAALAQRLGVNGTPTFIVNGERASTNSLRPTIERQLAQAKTAVK